MDLSTIRTSVYDRLGVPSNDALLTTAVLNRAINAALHEIESEQDWPWYQATETLTTSAGDATYTPGATWLRTRVLRVANETPLPRYSYEELIERWPFDSSTGKPREYAVEAGEIHLRPIPDGVYSLEHRFVAKEDDLDSDGESPMMPDIFHQAIVDLATHIVLRRSSEDARSQQALGDYERWRTKMIRHKRKFQGPARIRTRWG